MRLMVIFVGIFSFFFSSAKANKSTYETQGFTISKEDFFAFLRKESPEDLCEKKSYFQACFDITLNTCKGEAKKQLDECRLRSQVPRIFDVIELEHYAEIIGQCIGVGLEKKWIEEKKDSRECKKRF